MIAESSGASALPCCRLGRCLLLRNVVEGTALPTSTCMNRVRKAGKDEADAQRHPVPASSCTIHCEISLCSSESDDLSSSRRARTTSANAVSMLCSTLRALLLLSSLLVSAEASITVLSLSRQLEVGGSVARGQSTLHLKHETDSREDGRLAFTLDPKTRSQLSWIDAVDTKSKQALLVYTECVSPL